MLLLRSSLEYFPLVPLLGVDSTRTESCGLTRKTLGMQQVARFEFPEGILFGSRVHEPLLVPLIRNRWQYCILTLSTQYKCRPKSEHIFSPTGRIFN